MHGQMLNRREGIELYQIRQEAKLTDLLLVCCKNGQQRHIPANKVIFSTISPFLKRLFDTTNEKQPYEKVVIMIDSVDFAIMEKLIEYTYGGETRVNYQERQELAELCKLLQLEIPLSKLNDGLDTQDVSQSKDSENSASAELFEYLESFDANTEEVPHENDRNLEDEIMMTHCNASSNVHEIPESSVITHLQSLEHVSQNKDSENSASAELFEYLESFDANTEEVPHENDRNLEDEMMTHCNASSNVHEIPESSVITHLQSLEDVSQNKDSENSALAELFEYLESFDANTEEVPHENDPNLEDEMMTDQTFKSTVEVTGVKDVNSCTKSAMRKSGRLRNSRKRLKSNTEKITRVKGTISKQVSCKDCNYVTSYISLMNRHRKSHLKSKIQHCKECKYHTTIKCNLHKHINYVHLKIKPNYRCDQCDFSTQGQYNLTQHRNAIHLNIKSFKCKDCSFCSSYKNSLNEHIKRMHLRRNDLKCMMCNYSTSQKSRLNRHVKNVHNSSSLRHS